MSVGVIIVAGGRGARLGAAVPKQLLEISGRSMLRRAVETFDEHPRVDHLVVVLPVELVADAARLVGSTRRPCFVTAGGETRRASVERGLQVMPAGPDLILVHDAARPFASADLIDRVIRETEESGAAVPALPATETVKRTDPAGRTVRETIAREEVWLAQTPQGFRRDLLEGAMAARHGASGTLATDDAMLVEQTGHEVHVVMGDPLNVKITTADDLAAARARLVGPPRVGTGYDLHRLAKDRPLVLAGIEVAAERGPLGHSDGDVICHAVIDAMFGAAAVGDIGRHFPDSDPRWKDVAGLDLLRRARAIIEKGGYRVSSLDVTVILEQPKLAPHLPPIAERLAETLSLAPTAVGVKAKTNEGVDAIGRGEAIAAHSVVVLTEVGSA